MAAVSIPIEVKPDDPRGTVATIELCKDLGMSIVDVVIQEVKKDHARGCHYHPRHTGKVEIFVPLQGKAELVWHDRAEPKKECRQVMRPVFEARQVYRVETDTCHQVRGQGEGPVFLMLSLNNVAYTGEPDPKCEHGLKCDEN